MWTFSPFGNGNYTTYSAGVIANGATGYSNTTGDRIGSGQAFFVQANASGNVVFQEGHKITSAIPNTQYFGTSTDKLVRVGLKSTANALLDEIVIRFNDEGNVGYDSVWDAISFSSGNQTLATLKGDTGLAIATYPDDGQSDTARLRIHSSTTGGFSLAFSDFEGLVDDMSVMLKDRYLSTSQDIKTNPIYVFNCTNDTNSMGSNRFELVFVSNATSLAVNKITETASLVNGFAQITWNTIGEKTVAGYGVEKSIDGTSFNRISGMITPNASGSYRFIDSNLSADNNYYRIKAVGNDGSVSYGNVIRLTTYDLQLTTYNFYPNPLKGKTLDVRLGNVAVGKYVVCIYNVLGQEVYRHAISHVGGNGSYVFGLDKTLASGVYSVAIRNEDNWRIVYQTSLLVQQ